MTDMTSWDEDSKEPAQGHCPPPELSCSKADLQWAIVLNVRTSIFLCEILKGIRKCTHTSSHITKNIENNSKTWFLVHYITSRTWASVRGLTVLQKSKLNSIPHLRVCDITNPPAPRKCQAGLVKKPHQGNLNEICLTEECNQEFTGQINNSKEGYT